MRGYWKRGTFTPRQTFAFCLALVVLSLILRDAAMFYLALIIAGVTVVTRNSLI